MQCILVDEIMDNLKFFNVYLVLLFRKSWTELDGKMVCLKEMRQVVFIFEITLGYLLSMLLSYT